MKRTLLFVLMLLALTANAATVTGPLVDAGVSAATTRVEFWPKSTPFLSGTNLVIGGMRAVQARNGTFSVSLAAGRYEVKFPPTADVLNIFVPNDSNTYEISELATNIFRVLTAAELDELGTGTSGPLTNADSRAVFMASLETTNSITASNIIAPIIRFKTNGTATSIQMVFDPVGETLSILGEASSVPLRINWRDTAASGIVSPLYTGSGAGVTNIPESGVVGLSDALSYLTNNAGISLGDATNAAMGVAVLATNTIAASTLTGTIDDARLPATISSDITGTAALADNITAGATLNPADGGALSNLLTFTQTSENIPTLLTNRWTISGAGTAAANGEYYYNETLQTFTNSAGSGWDFQFDPLSPYITNAAGDYLYNVASAGNFALWLTATGDEPPPTGVIPSGNVARDVLTSDNETIFAFPAPILGSSAYFGSNINFRFPHDAGYGGGTLDTRAYSSFVGASFDSQLNGSFQTIFSGRQVTNNGQRVFIAASAFGEATATNAGLSVLNNEFFSIRQSDGIAVYLANSAFQDHAPNSTAYIVGNVHSYTNDTTIRYSTILGAKQYQTFGLGVYDSLLLNVNQHTNSTVASSEIIGAGTIVTNLSGSTIIGKNLRVNNATNVFLLGNGLASTSNHVAKIGFTGWHLLIQTNRLQLISNNVPFNITVTP